MSEADHLLVRQRPTNFTDADYVDTPPAYRLITGDGVVSITGLGWYRVERSIGERLRTVGMHDAAHASFGRAAFSPRFDVLEQSEFDALVAQQQAAIAEGQRERARIEAERAVMRVLGADLVAAGDVSHVVDAAPAPIVDAAQEVTQS
jgi:hypothetical protein